MAFVYLPWKMIEQELCAIVGEERAWVEEILLIQKGVMWVVQCIMTPPCVFFFFRSAEGRPPAGL